MEYWRWVGCCKRWSIGGGWDAVIGGGWGAVIGGGWGAVNDGVLVVGGVL